MCVCVCVASRQFAHIVSNEKKHWIMNNKSSLMPEWNSFSILLWKITKWSEHTKHSQIIRRSQMIPDIHIYKLTHTRIMAVKLGYSAVKRYSAQTRTHTIRNGSFYYEFNIKYCFISILSLAYGKNLRTFFLYCIS